MDTTDILKFKPNRLGHCTCIHPSLQGSKQLFDMLLESKIPVGKRSLIASHIFIIYNSFIHTRTHTHIYNFFHDTNSIYLFFYVFSVLFRVMLDIKCEM